MLKYSSFPPILFLFFQVNPILALYFNKSCPFIRLLKMRKIRIFSASGRQLVKPWERNNIKFPNNQNNVITNTRPNRQIQGK